MEGTANPYPTLDGENGTSTPGAFFRELFRNKKPKPGTGSTNTHIRSTYEPSIAQSDSSTLVGTEENVIRYALVKE
jgi:hypothetical protein